MPSAVKSSSEVLPVRAQNDAMRFALLTTSDELPPSAVLCQYTNARIDNEMCCNIVL
jgi:hypothetical protein